MVLLAACSSNRNQDIQLPEVVKIDRVIPYHIVQEGETVGSIAEHYSMTRADLVKLNNLTPPYQLYNGQRLIINVKVSDSAVQEDPDITIHEKTDTANTKMENTEEDTATIDDINTSPISPDVSNTPDPEVKAVQETEYVWPIAGGASKLSQKFDDSSDGGIIFKTSAGTPVRSIADGVVRIARTLDGDASSYGKTVIILHNSKSKLSVYSHLQEYSVKAGQKVKKGDIIGRVGKSGNAKSPQLYLQVFDVNKKDKSRTSIDPEKILPN